MKKILFGLAVVAVSSFGVYTASQDYADTEMSDLRLEDVEAEAQQTGDTYRIYSYENTNGETCRYVKCDQGGNYVKTLVLVRCTRTIQAGVAVSVAVTEDVPVYLNKCFVGGSPSCTDEDCAMYFALYQPD